MKDKYDILVIGAGHAGIEAAMAAARMGHSVGLITMDAAAIGRMSCNPAIGGTAKGHLVCEIDALGGVMGLIADRTGIQFRMLNRSKGPAVWSPRCQSDRELYAEEARHMILAEANIDVIEDSVCAALVENKQIAGVKTKSGREIASRALIVSSGTFLNGLMHTGLESTKGGRFGEMPALGLTESLMKLGFETGRLKTGTPPRLAKDSIDFSKLEEQFGDQYPKPFSYRTDTDKFPYQKQVSCHIAYTNPAVHTILSKNFDKSPMFTGRIKGVGPRYCPSIEDKIVRFADRERHQLFCEPEGIGSDLIYLNGFSSSLPAAVQLEALRRIDGFENVRMVRPGYAVEYDFFPPHQVDLTLETKRIRGLYFAGQVNGTSGYEEAAAQGLIAGINAACRIEDREEFVLKRSEAYIGVLIDDLVNKSTEEPYRMFTSRAEHRLILRQDNADRRLMSYGHRLGLISDEVHETFTGRKKLIHKGIELLKQTRLRAKHINPYLAEENAALLNNSETAAILCKRPQVSLKKLLERIPDEYKNGLSKLSGRQAPLEEIEIEIKYEGYIRRELDLIKKMEKLEERHIPVDFDFQALRSLSAEGREKLNKVKPRSIGQAARISGVTPSDISILSIQLKRHTAQN